MKKLGWSLILLVFAISVQAQVKFDLGIKGGVNFSKISLDAEDYSAESVTKSHFGAFGRLGWDRVFIQPEFYFSGKGGDVTSDIMSTMTSFDYSTIDIPVLLGGRIIKGKLLDLHVVAGPVFNKIVTKDLEASDAFDPSFYENQYFGIQYGVGIDVLFLTLDARMENGLGNFYSHSEGSGKNQTFMVSLGFKIL